jgi:hypothetical protein
MQALVDSLTNKVLWSWQLYSADCRSSSQDSSTAARSNPANPRRLLQQPQAAAMAQSGTGAPAPGSSKQSQSAARQQAATTSSPAAACKGTYVVENGGSTAAWSLVFSNPSPFLPRPAPPVALTGTNRTAAVPIKPAAGASPPLFGSNNVYATIKPGVWRSRRKRVARRARCLVQGGTFSWRLQLHVHQHGMTGATANMP